MRTPEQQVAEFVIRLQDCGATYITIRNLKDGVIAINATVPNWWKHQDHETLQFFKDYGHGETMRAYWYYVPKFNRIKNWSGPSPYKTGSHCNLFRKCVLCKKPMRKTSVHDNTHRKCMLSPQYADVVEYTGNLVTAAPGIRTTV